MRAALSAAPSPSDPSTTHVGQADRKRPRFDLRPGSAPRGRARAARTAAVSRAAQTATERRSHEQPHAERDSAYDAENQDTRAWANTRPQSRRGFRGSEG